MESTNFIPEVRNTFETYNTDIVPYQTSSHSQGSTNYYDSTFTNFDTNAYNTTSSAYELNSVPVEISPSLSGNDDTELIPILDQGKGSLILYESLPSNPYLDKSLETFKNLEKVVEALDKKVRATNI